MSKKIFFNEEEVRSLYEDTFYTAEDVAKKLGVGTSTLVRFLRANNICKNKEKYYAILSEKQTKVPKPTREEIVAYYIEENHSKKDSAMHFKISETQFSRWLSSYSIRKPSDKKRERCVIAQSYKKKTPPSLTELQEKYLNTDKKQDEVIADFDVSLSTFRRWLMSLGTHKSAETMKATIEKSNLERLGCPWSGMEHVAHLDIWINKDKFIDYLVSGGPKKTVDEIGQYFNVGQTAVFRNIDKFQARDFVDLNASRSSGEVELYNIILPLEQGEIKVKDRSVLSGKELDIYLPQQQLAIEYNGTYWHSDWKCPKGYHYKKSLSCERAGVRLIHIYEYEWEDPRKRPILESLLKIALGVAESKIYARNCEIRELSNREAKPFNEKNHLQGHRNAQVTLGLFYKGELVQLMSFSRTKYNKNLKNDNEWEIIRGCPGSNNIVIGGVSKLFKHFIRRYSPQKIFSYCDFNKFDGSGYEAIGMQMVGYTGPDLNWVLKGNKVVPRLPSKHQELKKSAIAKIWGAGSKKYVWTSSEK